MNERETAKFWRHVAVAEDMRACWPWTGLLQNGYGSFGVDGRQRSAHRLAWAFAYGPIPIGGIVLHSCDTTSCVNPRHLRIGTHEENNLDRTVLSRVRKVIDEDRAWRERESRQAEERREQDRVGRLARVVPGGPDGIVYAYGYRGVRPTTKQLATLLAKSPLSATGVRYIRDLYSIHGVDFRTIAKVCRIEEWRAYAVIRRSTWRHIP